MAGAQSDKSVAGLPFARGRTFTTLDEYLAYRKTLGATDISYYEEVEPGRYRLVGGRGTQGRPAQFFSRDELMGQFGFTK